jgi:hypothetical protein
LPVLVRCLACGGVHPSRIRARDAASFAAINPNVGPVQERCPACRTWTTRSPADRRWHDPAAEAAGARSAVRRP